MLSNIIGQNEIKQNLNILIKSSVNSIFPHTLIAGPPGVGKTSFARAIADELGCKFTEINSAYTGYKDEFKIKLILALEEIKRGDLIFIDEIHALHKSVQEMLYTAMEDLYINYGDLFGSKKQIEPFTIIGATTDIAGITNAMQSRFKHIVYVREYNDCEISDIINSKNTEIDSHELSKYCRGNPRLALNNIDWITRYCSVKSLSPNKENIELAMKAKGVFKYGLTENDLNYLRVVKSHRIIGVRNISHILNIEEKTIKFKIEPYLIKLGLIYINSKNGKRCPNISKYEEYNL